MVIDVLADVRVDDVIKMLVEVFVINMRDGVVIGTLSGANVDVTIAVVSDIAVVVLNTVNVNILVAAMIDLQFVMPAS